MFFNQNYSLVEPAFVVVVVAVNELRKLK